MCIRVDNLFVVVLIVGIFVIVGFSYFNFRSGTKLMSGLFVSLEKN